MSSTEDQPNNLLEALPIGPLKGSPNFKRYTQETHSNTTTRVAQFGQAIKKPSYYISEYTGNIVL